MSLAGLLATPVHGGEEVGEYRRMAHRGRHHQEKREDQKRHQKMADCPDPRPSGGYKSIKVYTRVGLSTSKSRNEGLGVGRGCRASRRSGFFFLFCLGGFC